MQWAPIMRRAIKTSPKRCQDDELLAIFSLGQELSVKPFSLLSTKPRNARSAYGGPKGRPAGDERHRQK
jgi:hypothetical protein